MNYKTKSVIIVPPDLLVEITKSFQFLPYREQSDYSLHLAGIAGITDNIQMVFTSSRGYAIRRII